MEKRKALELSTLRKNYKRNLKTVKEFIEKNNIKASHYRHIANGLLTSMNCMLYLFEREKENYEKKKGEYIMYLRAFRTYHDLLNEYPEFMKTEIINSKYFTEVRDMTSEDGCIPGEVNYVFEAKIKLGEK